MATIRRRGNKYQVQVRKDGYKTVSATFSSVSVARGWAKAIESDMERNMYIQRKDKTTVGELLKRYTSEVIARQRSNIASTYMAQTLDTHLGTIAISRLTPEKIGRFRDIRLKNISPASLKREFGILSGMINHAIREWGLNIQQNPISMVSLPKMPQGRDRRLELGEEEQLLSSSGELKRLIILALETGMRRGEILNIKKSHINFTLQTLLIPLTKTDTPRTIPLSSRAIAVLREQLRGSEKVIPIEETTLFSYKPDSVTQAFGRLCKRQGIDNLHFHDLRHEATSRFFEKGLNPVEVATITGHKDTRMLMRYTHLRAEDLVKRLG